MKQLFSLPLIALLLTACNNNSTEPTSRPVAAEGNETEPINSCFVYTSAKDTVNLHLKISGNMVTGDLAYNYFEKDKNTGTIQGNIKGDTIFAAYTFLSEGTISIREVAFLKTGNDFVEGYGDVEEKNGKIIFKNTSGLSFNNKLILKNVACEK